MKKIEIPEFLIPDFRSNHAGEIGAVYIYKTAIICAISAKSRQMSKDHLKTEENHLQIIKDHYQDQLDKFKNYDFINPFIN